MKLLKIEQESFVIKKSKDDLLYLATTYELMIKRFQPELVGTKSIENSLMNSLKNLFDDVEG